jgi:hypothetical protein
MPFVKLLSTDERKAARDHRRSFRQSLFIGSLSWDDNLEPTIEDGANDSAPQKCGYAYCAVAGEEILSLARQAFLSL